MIDAAEQRPLAGRRVLVTRAPHQASELADRLRQAGAEPILIPTIQIADPVSFKALDAALRSFDTFDWVVFTSANAVEALDSRASALALTPTPRQIAVIGPATERALHAIGWAPDLVPPTAVAEALAEALAPLVADRSVLLVRAAEARDVLPDALRSAGARITIAEAYRNVRPPESVAALRALFAHRATRPDAVTFTSASTGRHLAAALKEAALTLPSTVVRASIGPITSEALRELGLPPHVEAREASVAGLVEALVAHFASG